MRIDSHHHFWNYTDAEYGWLVGPMDALRRDFVPSDLKPLLDEAGITGVISVEARQNEIETAYLLNFASQHDWIRGVVGYVPLESPRVRDSLERFAQNRHFRGVRKVVQGMPEGTLLHDDFNRGVGFLKHFGLVYDILIYARQLPEAIEFVDRHPQQTFVLDHVAKPDIANGGFMPWADDIRRLSERQNVYCKLSGMATEADWAAWHDSQLRPYFDTVLDCFGPARLMFGSDWPVCTVAVSHGDWVKTVENWTKELSAAEQARIWAGTAIEAYSLKGLPVPSPSTPGRGLGRGSAEWQATFKRQEDPLPNPPPEYRERGPEETVRAPP